MAEDVSGKLIPDIDYILEWVRADSKMKLRIVPTSLTFLNVQELRMSLDYAASSAAHGPFSIHQIMHRSETRERNVAQIWSISINWPKGEFEFVATGFEQNAVGKPVLCDGQLLEPGQGKSIVI